MAESAGGRTRGAVARVAAAVRRERERSGLSLSELARRAGLSKSTLSQVEAAAGNPGVETIWALAAALDVSFATLIDPPEQQVQFVGVDEEPETVAAEGSPYLATLLSAAPNGSRRDLYRIRCEPGTPRRSDPHQAGTVEHVVLVRGRALVGPVTDPVELGVGDYLSYPASVAHTFEALRPGTTAVIVVEHR